MAVATRKVNEKQKVLSELIIPYSGGDFMTISYSRDMLTPLVEKELNESVKQGLNGEMYARYLKTIIKKWDVMEVAPESRDTASEFENSLPEGTVPSMADYEIRNIKMVVVPISVETLRAFFSIDQLRELIDAINKDQLPNPSNSDFTSNS